MSEYPWLLLAVYVVTVGTVQLLALWAATSTRPWLLRALAVWTPILLLMLIRATWPAMLLFMSALQTIWICFLIERLRKERNSNRQSTWRFRLADLLVVMLFLGTWLALASKIVPLAHQASLLLFVGLAALPLALLAVLARGMVPGPWRATMGVVALGLVWTCAVLMRLGNAPLFLGEGRPSLGTSWSREEAFWAASDGLFPLAALVCLAAVLGAWRMPPQLRAAPIVHRTLFVSTAVGLGVAIPLVWIVWDGFGWTIVSRQFWQHNLEVANHTIFVFALSGFLVVMTWLIRAAGAAENPKLKIRAQRSLLALAVLLGVPGTWLYWQMACYAPFPEVKAGSVNHYERLVGIAKKMDGYTNRGPLPAPLAAELDQAVVMLRGYHPPPSHVLELNVAMNGREPGLTGYDLMAINRRFREAAELAKGRGDFNRAADYAVAFIRFDAMAGAGDSAGYCLEGYQFLAEFRGKVSADKARDIIGLLRQTIAERHDLDTVVAVQRAQWERMRGWRVKLRSVLARVTGSPSLDKAFEAFAAQTQQQRKAIEVWNVLLQADLAIRIFQVENGRLPKDLKELTPKILPEVPRDPFSASPLVYRANGNDFLLYSVGFDGQDDGGTFWNRGSALPERFDLRLEPLPAK